MISIKETNYTSIVDIGTITRYASKIGVPAIDLAGWLQRQATPEDFIQLWLRGIRVPHKLTVETIYEEMSTRAEVYAQIVDDVANQIFPKEAAAPEEVPTNQ
jgi:hypothetical protein